ncbi:hypothetical protein [Methanococcoides sp. NM1]|uniref:hypothetical protein n=1 Tax=Methanococcoides sp. NM1 TaxID=1201013 RepID=UPI00108425E4|nr:hypothetical protein [Methanococcoides sp. NM1]
MANEENSKWVNRECPNCKTNIPANEIECPFCEVKVGKKVLLLNFQDHIINIVNLTTENMLNVKIQNVKNGF